MALRQDSLRSPRAVASSRSPHITTRLDRQRMCSSPALHDSSSWLVVNVCSRALVSGFTLVLTLVLVLAWKGWVLRFMAAPFGVVFVCMAAMFGVPLFPVYVQNLRSRT
ncbi:hypothetical protein [Delftia acidovorans]|uniref:hypothetical protein n=1 Tax=Delftia acidovorans TaxID=80866 RepID=UPI0005C1B930|nr:hypothetical protein [Delftia acidovorans]